MLSSSLLVGSPAAEVAHCLIEADAYRIADPARPDTFYRWKCGISAPSYLDCRTAVADPSVRREVVDAFVRSASLNFPHADGVVGLSESGIGWGMLVAEALDLPAHFVRKEAKRHGTGRLVEPPPAAHREVLVIDDLVASGASVEAALGHLADCGVRALGVLSIANWGFVEMHRRLAGCPVRALTSYPQLLAAALVHQQITTRTAAALARFYTDPRGESRQEPRAGRHALVPVAVR